MKIIAKNEADGVSVQSNEEIKVVRELHLLRSPICIFISTHFKLKHIQKSLPDLLHSSVKINENVLDFCNFTRAKSQSYLYIILYLKILNRCYKNARKYIYFVQK